MLKTHIFFLILSLKNVILAYKSDILLQADYHQFFRHVGQLLIDQASNQNGLYKEGEGKFLDLLSEKNVVVKNCGHILMTKGLVWADPEALFFQWPNVVKTSDYPLLEFNVNLTLTSLMHFRTDQIFQIDTDPPSGKKPEKIEFFEITGGCLDAIMELNKSAIHDEWTPKYGDGKISETIFRELVENTILSAEFSKGGIEEKWFTTGFSALIDLNTNLRDVYDFKNFVRYMKRFTKRYTLMKDIENINDMYDKEIEANLVVVTQSVDHIVFRKTAIYHHNFRQIFELWDYQVELIYNIDGNSTWQVNQIYQTPPHEYLIFENLARNNSYSEILDLWETRLKNSLNIEKFVKKVQNFENCNDSYPETFQDPKTEVRVLENSKSRLEFEIFLRYTKEDGVFEVGAKFGAIWSPKFAEHYLKNLTMTCPVTIGKKNSNAGKFVSQPSGNVGLIAINSPKEIVHQMIDAKINLFIKQIYKTLVQQSSVYNSDYEKAVADLKAHFHRYCDQLECLVATLCDGETLNYSTFFNWLAVQRRKFLKPVYENEPRFEVTQSPGISKSLQFTIRIAQRSLMNLEDEQILEFDTVKTKNSRNWRIRSVKFGGGCSSSRTHRSKYNLIPILENPGINGDGKMDDGIYDELLDSTIFRDDFSENLTFFEQDLRVIIDTNIFENYTYSLDEYAKYMTRFSKRYKLRRDIMKSHLLFDQSKNPSTSVLIHNPDHLVFRTSAIYQYLPDLELGQVTTEIWEYQVEAVFNVSSSNTWKIRQIFMEPPQFFTASSNFAELRARNEFVAEETLFVREENLDKSCSELEKFNGKNYVEVSRSHGETVVRVVGKYDSKFDKYEYQGIFKKC
ncbi:unnamed protein product [Caenorhabditis angaria]|uniref:Uncharacterized protein n=1 Tax=Caenorhabditis angaria TaxID=860376 RepID=A0A9P1MTZ9_9PELO|nr:unnamed protein product [Caenorhabditis angaria]